MYFTGLMADMLARDLEALKWTLGDFSDADMLARPTPAANHAIWQLGHLAVAEGHLVNAAAPGAIAAPSPEFAAKFTKETSKIDDPKAFPTKAQVLDVLSNARAATIAWVKTLTEADLKKEMPEKMREWVPTVGHLVAMLPSHVTMHVGQFQVTRRKLGKPVLF